MSAVARGDEATPGRRLVVERLLRVAVKALRAGHGFVHCTDEVGAELIVSYGCDAPSPAMIAFHGRVRAARCTIRGDRVVQAGRGLASLGAPVFGFGGADIGVLSVHVAGERTWSDEDVDVLEDIAWLPDLGVNRVALRRELGVRRDAEHSYRDLVELSPDAMLLHTDGVVVFANSAALRLVGATQTNQVVGRPIGQFLAPPYLPIVNAELVSPGSKVSANAETSVVRVDGTRLDVEVSAIPFVFRDRASVQVVMRDISARLVARSEVVAADKSLHDLAPQLPVIIWTADRDNRPTSVLGDAASPFGAHAAAALYQGSGLPLAGAAPQHAESEGLSEVHLDGRTYAQRVEKLRDTDGEHIGSVGVAFDVTAWKRIDEIMRDAARLDDIGRLAGGVAHEINNVLAIVMGLGSLLTRDEPPDVVKKAQAIVLAARRGADITRNLLAFAMREVHRPQPLALRPVLEDVINILAARAPDGVAIDLAADADLAEVAGDPAHLSHAFVDVGVNALEAMTAGGRLTIRLANVRRRHPGSPPTVRIRFADTGKGMTDEVRKRVFEPFFTAGKVGPHVGLGLSMVRGVVQQHGGEIRVSSSSEGTVVTIDLPAAVEPTVPVAVPLVRADTSARPKVLVVDDEPMLRHVTGMLVEGRGYEVVEAANGMEALARFGEAPDTFAVVLLDLVMPGLSGIEVLGRLVMIDPDVRVVLCTGYPRTELDATVFSLGSVAYLGKPFSEIGLWAEIATVTGAVGG